MCRFVVFFVWKLLLFGLITNDKKFYLQSRFSVLQYSVIIRTYEGIGINIVQIMEYYKNKRRKKTRGRYCHKNYKTFLSYRLNGNRCVPNNTMIITKRDVKVFFAFRIKKPKTALHPCFFSFFVFSPPQRRLYCRLCVERFVPILEESFNSRVSQRMMNHLHKHLVGDCGDVRTAARRLYRMNRVSYA